MFMPSNEGKSTASFCQMAATFPYKFLYVKNQKITKNSITPKAREKMSTNWESLEFWNFLMYI
jgi:hypothetical protein